ncbi:hypothetical protein EUTSA_v10029137mg [Eutrema salsugineum]|uniref:TF-B3 domain-containing protein n=1 Tax=Eutrema salsugineum TaxID=72664 RepID=V4L4F2_EUTSA|nr:B3 domain-containing protein REM13 [Eutrema salsugineum]ESQ38509.1 hypothetical protein EUTSA_v10029137mg [Eutrema salsugineum]
MAKSKLLHPQSFHTLVPSNNNDDEELPRKKKLKKNRLDEKVSNEEEEDMESLMEVEKKKKQSPKPKRRAVSYASYSPCHKRLVTFTLPSDYVKISSLTLPKPFLRENGINKPEKKIYLLGKDGTKWPTSLLKDNKGIMSLGSGWKDFVKANGLETGFTLKLMWEGTTPSFSLWSSESASDVEEEEEFSKDPSKIEKMRQDENKKEERQRDSTPSSQKQFVTITITPDNLRKNRLRFPKQFVKENSMNKPGMIYLLRKDGTKWMVNLVQERDGRMSLGSGWRVFAEANDLKPGESFTLEAFFEDTTPMVRFIRTECNNSEASKKESVSKEDTETRNRNTEQFVTLTLIPDDVRACKLHLPSQFMKANGINRLGKITLLGENKMEWPAYLLSTRDGTVALEYGWDGFCEANGVKLGEDFTLEFIYEQGTVTVLRFCSK